MKRICCTYLLCATALLLSATLAPPPEPELDIEGLSPVPVVEVLDGGRVKVMLFGEVATVKLLGVAAPDPAGKNELMAQTGAAARAALTELLAGQDVVLDPDPERPKHVRSDRWPVPDKDGMLSAHIWRVSDGLLVNAELLRRGLAFYNSGSTKREQYLRWYSWCQRQARDAGIGLWSGSQLVAAGNPVPPAPASGGMPDISLPNVPHSGGTAPAPGGGTVSAPYNHRGDSVEVLPEFTGGLDPAAEAPSGIRLRSATARVTQQNASGWDLAWQVGLKNTTRRRAHLNVTVRFLDADGYVLAEHEAAGVSVPARGAVEARGTQTLSLDLARRVGSLNVLIARAP